MRHSIELHRRLYLYLKESGLFDYRREIVFDITNGRTNNSSDMNTQETIEMIDYVRDYAKGEQLDSDDFVQGDTMRKKILSLSIQYGWSRYDRLKKKRIVDFEKLDAWMLKYSYLKKKMNQYKYAELPKLVSQFKEFVHKYVKSF